MSAKYVRRLAGSVVAVLAATLIVAADIPAHATDVGTTATFTDTFERADGAVGNGWTAMRGTWQIRSGSVTATGDPERVMVRATDVGPAYTASTSLTLTPVATGHAWSGVVTNVLNNDNGTQSYYVLRVGQSDAEAAARKAPWQLVRIDHSTAAASEHVLASGSVAAAAGTRLSLSVQVAAGSTMTVRVTGGATPVVRTVTIRTIDRIAGGRAGVYSQAGTNPLHDFTLVTTADANHRTFSDGFQRADGTIGMGWRAGRGVWKIADGRVVASGVGERVMYQTGVPLGDSFTAAASVTLPSPAPSGRTWTGLAVNVIDHGDQLLDYYTLRVAQTTADGNTAQWQLVKITRSAPATSTMASGLIAAPPGSTLNLTVTSRNLSTGLEVGITGPGLTPSARYPVNDYAKLPLGTSLKGGYAGVYNNAGSQAVNDFTVLSSTRTANPPTSFPALDCNTLPTDYHLPGTAYEVDPNPSLVDTTTWAGTSVGRAMLTSGNDQYVAYYDADRAMTIAKRTLPAGTWTYKRLASTVGWDTHNYLTMSLDATGQLHVAGNMHADPLVYFRTTTAGSISTLTRVSSMVSANPENSVTYPKFLTAPDGALLFNYRHGSSSTGVSYYNRYNTSTKTWSRFLATPLIDGQGMRNGYDTGIVPGPDGRYHLTVMWRDTGDAGSNSMPTYVRSSDMVNWQDSAGNPIPLPITYAKSRVVDHAPIWSGMLNNSLRAGWDAAGNLLIAYMKYDENLTNQIYLARPDGNGNWTQHKLTNFTGQWWVAGTGTLAAQIGVTSGVSVLPDGNLRIDIVCHGAKVLIVDPDTMTAIAMVSPPQLPAEISQRRSTFPGIAVRTVTNGTAAGTYVMRWESQGSNNDQPREPEDTAPPQPLEVYLLRPVSP